MALDFRRIEFAVDTQRLAKSIVIVVGCGGSHHLVTNLARSGIGHFILIDPDSVGDENICRTGYAAGDIGQQKVEALARAIREVGTGATVERRPEPVEAVEELQHFHGMECGGKSCWKADLIIAATDSFAAQARVNELAVSARVPALYVGLTRQGLGGEIVFWYPGLPCFRCLMEKRYQLHAESPDTPSLNPPSDGATIFDTDYADAIAGQIALRILLRRTTTRFGRLIAALDDRNFLRVKIDPTYTLGGHDLVRRELGIPADNPHFAGWCVAAHRDPARGKPPCPDCQANGHVPYGEHDAFIFFRPEFPLGRELNKCGK